MLMHAFDKTDHVDGELSKIGIQLARESGEYQHQKVVYTYDDKNMMKKLKFVTKQTQTDVDAWHCLRSMDVLLMQNLKEIG